eukprot:5901616-Alexandrium_andersonii.AAC.1
MFRAYYLFEFGHQRGAVLVSAGVVAAISTLVGRKMGCPAWSKIARPLESFATVSPGDATCGG